MLAGMAKRRLPAIEVGYQAFAVGSEEEFGAVREVGPSSVVIYIEDFGDTSVPLTAVTDVLEEKVIVDTTQLEKRVQDAIERAHRDEDYP
jgi:hypothetical protein